jgi:hypothetical protein
MISQQKYQGALGQIGSKFKNVNINWHSWYLQFLYYESMWNNYFETFIDIYSKLGKSVDIQFVFWESCPGGMPFPHQNYVFDSSRFNNLIHGTFDSYLKKECTAFNIDWEHLGKKRKIGEIIIDLAKKGILIIDIYPTHGIDLNSGRNLMRKNLFNNLFDAYSITEKFNQIGIKTNGFLKGNSNIKVTNELWNAGISNSMHISLKIKVQNSLGLTALPNFVK